MSDRPRMLDSLLREHVREPRGTLFVTGPGQVGKTTPCRAVAGAALDWRDPADRRLILEGPAAVVEQLGLARLRDAVVLFDNLRSYRKLPALLRGVRARCGSPPRLIGTGVDSARGTNYAATANFSHLRLHPLSVGECA